VTYETPWWQDAVIYQVYVKSFADSDADGIGDLDGVTAKLDHLERLGVDGLWLNPCYPSPGRDGGYDIADYFAIDQTYGGVEALDRLIAAAHERGLKVLLDIVPNHCSSEHPWFQEALAQPPGGAMRRRFHFHDGRGPAGELPPNNWQSVFTGPAWTRTRNPDGTPGQWYLHSFDSAQPDFNWDHPAVREHFRRALRHWFDRGIDGFRIDVAAMLLKAAGLPDRADGQDTADLTSHQPGVHEVYRDWREVCDGYAADRTRALVGEIWARSGEEVTSFLGHDELHAAFYFDLMTQPWQAAAFRDSVQEAMRALDALPPAGADKPTGSLAWVLNSHDAHRSVSRYGLVQSRSSGSQGVMGPVLRPRGDVDVPLGQARARAALLLLLALPGSVYLYQGEEFGLPEVMDLPDAARQDPIWLRSAGAEHGRDGCRVPLPWRGDAPAFGFSPAGAAAPWLPQPAWFRDYACDRQEADPSSFLAFYRAALEARQTMMAQAAAHIEWLETSAPRAAADLLAFRRGGIIVVTVFGDEPFALPEEWGDIAVSSAPAVGRELPGSSTAWLNPRRRPA
jgi:alpha-glucosidase